MSNHQIALGRIKKRPEFLHVRKGLRVHSSTFLLQARQALASDGQNTARFGFTVTKKVGNSVERNPIKRRLRGVVNETAPAHVLVGWDYVLLASRNALNCPFEQLSSDLAHSLDRIGKKASKASRQLPLTKHQAPSKPKKPTLPSK